MSVNRVELLGRCHTTPVVEQLPTGTSMLRFVLSTTERRGDAYETQFHSCVVYGGAAERTQPMLNKGLEVYVSGKLWTRAFEDRHGTRRTSVEVVCSTVRVCMAPEARGESKV